MIYARGYFAVGLCLPRDHKNVACALRACSCFGASFLAYSGRRYQKHAADTNVSWRHMPLHLAGDEPKDIMRLLPHACVPVAIELDPRAKPLTSYVHPERAYYIFGPEDGSIPESVLSQCADVVKIPSRFCLNLSVALGVVLYDRVSKGAPNKSLYENGSKLQAEAQ